MTDAEALAAILAELREINSRLGRLEALGTEAHTRIMHAADEVRPVLDAVASGPLRRLIGGK